MKNQDQTLLLVAAGVAAFILYKKYATKITAGTSAPQMGAPALMSPLNVPMIAPSINPAAPINANLPTTPMGLTFDTISNM